MDNKINAHCSICGKGYSVCNSCLEQKSFKPWRTIVDSIEHYKIYMVLHEYTLSRDINAARVSLKKCNLDGLENFNNEVKNTINLILSSEERQSISKPEKKASVNISTTKNK